MLRRSRSIAQCMAIELTDQFDQDEEADKNLFDDLLLTPMNIHNKTVKKGSKIAVKY
jgi:hypothetical protein